MTTEMLRRMIEQGAERQREAQEKERLAAERQQLFDDFKNMDRSSISSMDDFDLAAWQAQFPKESPQFIFGDQLWKYRLARKSAKFAALIATLAALVGAAVGYVIRGAEEVPKDKTNGEVQQNVSPPVPNKPVKPQ